MRLNFQQQRAINPSAPANTFIAEREAPGQNQFALQRQIVQEATGAITDTANAATIIAKANQKLEKQEQQTVLDNIELDSYKAGKQFQEGTQSNKPFQVNVKDESISYELPTEQYYGKVGQNFREEVLVDRLIQKYSTDQYGPGFNKKVELKVRRALSPAFANAQKISIANTKNAVVKQLRKNGSVISGQVLSGDTTIYQGLAKIETDYEVYRDTLGVETDKYINDDKRNLVSSFALQASKGDASQRMALNNFLKQESYQQFDDEGKVINPGTDLSPLFILQLDQQFSPIANQFAKNETFVLLKNQTESDDIDKVKEFLVNYTVADIIEGDDGSVAGITVEPTLDYYDTYSSFFDQKQLNQFAQNAGKKYVQLLNKNRKIGDWSKKEFSFSRQANNWMDYHVQEYERNPDLSLSIQTTGVKPPDPRKAAEFDEVSGNAGYVSASQVLDNFDSHIFYGKGILNRKITSKNDINRLDKALRAWRKWLESVNIPYATQRNYFKRYYKTVELDYKQRVKFFIENPVDAKAIQSNPNSSPVERSNMSLQNLVEEKEGEG